MSNLTDGSHIRCALLNPRPGVYAEIRWLRRDALHSMPIAELSRYRFPEKSVFLFSRLPAADVSVYITDVLDEDQIIALCRRIDDSRGTTHDET